MRGNTLCPAISHCHPSYSNEGDTKYANEGKILEMSPTDSGSLELAVLAAATVIAGRGNLLLFEFRLAGNTQPNTRNSFTASLDNSFVAFLAMC